MKGHRVSCAALLVLGLAMAGVADDPKARVQGQRKVEAQLIRLGAAGGDLLSAKALEKLDLKKDQKEKFDKINQEFKEKFKDAQSQVQQAYQDKDRAKVRDATQAMQKLRPDYLAKVETVLTDTQKKIFAEVRQENPKVIRPNIGIQPGRTPGQILPPQLQEKLQLTDEQKKKLEELQKEVDSKLRQLLNDDQKKILDQLKNPAAPRVRPGRLQANFGVIRQPAIKP